MLFPALSLSAVPSQLRTPLLWLRRHLFSSVPQTVLTLLLAVLMWNVGNKLLHWGILDAVWYTADRTFVVQPLAPAGQLSWKNIALFCLVFTLTMNTGVWCWRWESGFWHLPCR